MNTNPKAVKRLSSGFCLLLIATFVIFSCQKENIRPIETTDEIYLEKDMIDDADQVCGPIMSKSLLLENGTKVGDVLIYNDAHYLYVSTKTLHRFQLGTAYLYVGDEKGIPVGLNGELQFQNFNYIHRVSAFDPQNSHYFRIPLNTLSSKNALALNIKVFSLDEEVNAWALGGLSNDARHPEIFHFERTLCELSNETKY